MYNGFNFVAFAIFAAIALIFTTCGLVYALDREKGMSEMQAFRDALIPIELIGFCFIVVYFLGKL